MKILIKKDQRAASRFVADQIIALVNQKTSPVLGLPTGSTPKGVYDELIKSYNQGNITFKHVTSFNLDEYLGLDPKHEQSYAYYMQKNLFEHVDFDPAFTHIYNGTTKDPNKECAHYTRLIKDSGGIDFQLLGIGLNGHIGFNEPRETFKLHSHVVKLDEKTRKANARFFKDKTCVPKEAMTMGIDEIMASRAIVLLAFGKDKAKMMAKLLLSDDIDPNLPASILHVHPNVTVVMDEAAARLYQKNRL